ncbi:MAG: methylmalonyl Co-A mutase-associated GTPase MeaB [Trueperaceae bacterium]|nr:MAG: methylmalonyl Co-A mutase-associated GTPase MeaB [Trueperaceae bacterium]
MTASLLDRFLAQDERALARAISSVEGGREEGRTLLAAVRQRLGRARIVGITGAPGSGKSTLTDKLIELERARDARVAVIAVDPTSPYSGGAILGDRIRMMRWYADDRVFIRSMATRGHLGGVAATTLQVLNLLDAYGFDVVFVETVGVGQSEVEIVQVADTTVLVLTPNQGDGVQVFKAGIMEIADLFVINKFDLPGGPRLKREIEALLELDGAKSWRPPILEVTASKGEGIVELVEQLDAHRSHLVTSGALTEQRRERIRFELRAALGEQLLQRFITQEDRFVEAVLAGRISPEEAVRELLKEL